MVDDEQTQKIVYYFDIKDIPNGITAMNQHTFAVIVFMGLLSVCTLWPVPFAFSQVFPQERILF